MNKPVHQRPIAQLHCGECAHLMQHVCRDVVQCENKRCPQRNVQFDVSMYAHAREKSGA